MRNIINTTAIFLLSSSILSGVSLAQTHNHGAHSHGHAHRHGHNTPKVESQKATPEHSIPIVENDHGIETENMFGFTSGSDTDEAGSKIAAMEVVGRLSKRDGDYTAISKKFEFGYGITDNFSAAVGLLTSFHSIKDVTGFENVEGYRFNGIGGELRYRFLNRAEHGVGVTLHLEPSWQTHDEVTGIQAVKFGSENKLIIDKELIPGKLYGAFNILHEMENVKEKGAEANERGSVIGPSIALSYQIMPNVFFGAEARYLRAYEGLSFKRYEGDAVFVGPNIFAHLNEQWWISAAWGTQVYGKAQGSTSSLNLDNFDRHQFRIKIGMHF